MSIVNEIREKQNLLITMINSTFDELVEKVEKLQSEGNLEEMNYEVEYPLTNSTGFKGKKPIAVKMNSKRIITPTWKKVVENILLEVMQDNSMKEKILSLRDILLGRVRTRVSKIPNNMRSPIKLCEGLYIETHYDTETLINLLIEILHIISYDYNNIKIVIKNK